MNNKEKYFLVKAATVVGEGDPTVNPDLEDLFDKPPVIPVLDEKPPVIPVLDTGEETIWEGGGGDYGDHPEMPGQTVYKPEHPTHFRSQDQADADKIDEEIARETALANAAESLRNGGNLVESSGGKDTGLTVGDVKKEVTRLDDMDIDHEAQRADQGDGKVYADKSLAAANNLKAPTREQAGRGKEEWGGTLEEGKPYRKPQEKKDEPGTPWWHYALGLGGLGGLGYLGYNMLTDDDDEDDEEKRKKRRRR